MTFDELVHAVTQLVAAQDVPAFAAILEQHQALLLQPDTDRGLTAAIAARRGQQQSQLLCDLLAVRGCLADYARIGQLEQVLNQTYRLPLAAFCPLHTLLQRVRKEGSTPQEWEQRIALAQQALHQVRRATEPDWWAALHHLLGEALVYTPEGIRSNNLRRAILHYWQALKIWQQLKATARWSETLSGLDRAWEQYALLDPARFMSRAISFYTRMLARIDPANTAESAMLLHTLGNLWCQLPAGSRATNIEQAVETYRKALELRSQMQPPDEKTLAQTHSGMGNAYLLRIHGDRAANIEQAIQHYQAAHERYQQQGDVANQAETCTNLAVAFRIRRRSDRAANVEQAIAHAHVAATIYNQAQQTHTRPWARVQTELATLSCMRLEGERADNLEQAIGYYQAGLTVYTPETFPLQWAHAHSNLANAYCDRVTGDHRQNLRIAIEHYQQALLIRTAATYPREWAETQNNLGTAYAELGETRQAQACYENAATIRTVTALPAGARQTYYNLGNLFFQMEHWSEAVTAYQTAIEAAESLYQASLLRGSRESELAETADLYQRAAYALARTDCLQEAILTLEQGRARGVGEALTRDRTDLHRLQTLDAAAYQSYEQAAAQVRELDPAERTETTPPNVADALLSFAQLQERADAAYTHLKTAVDRIRSIAGYETFLAAPQWEAITQAVRPDVPLLYLVTSPAGSLALIVHRPNPSADITLESIRLPSFTLAALHTLVHRWFDAYGQWTHQPQRRATAWESTRWHLVQREVRRKGRKQADWLTTIATTMRDLWDHLMGEPVTTLCDRGYRQAVLIPTGLLSLLPLHAAWTAYPEHPDTAIYALDRLALTYAPSARTLNFARQMADQVQADHNILIIQEPAPVGASALPNATTEVQNIVRFFSQHQILRHEQATRAATCQALPAYQVAHFCCHGLAHWTNPDQSGLLMAHNEFLTVENLFEVQLSTARLAVLSACETGVVGMGLPDEVIALPAALLRVGFACVVASLWSVADASTAELMEHFYTAWRRDGLEPALALQKAQQQLRTIPRFRHPFYWAAFYVMGG